MILKSTPYKPVKFPPASYIAKHHVKTGENWQSVATKFHRSDPWDLIEFNFQTRSPREVNWYLETLVGCTKSNDGKNYSFDTADSPGEIYIPHSHWTPSADLALRQSAIFSLTGAALARLNVTYKGQTITGRSLAAVGNAIIDGHIRVIYDPTLQANEAEYIAIGHNVLKLGFPKADLITKQGLVVHEAVHAALDMRSAGGINIAESESLAYAVQCYYVRARTGDPAEDRLVDEDPEKDQVYHVAWQIAGHLLDGNQPSSIEWLALDHAVRRHPKYKDDASDIAIFDGI